MYKKDTGELEKQLESTHPEDIDRYLQENEEETLSEDRPFMKYMKEKLREKNLQKQDVFVQADISLGYGYKLLTQEKTTRQRDVILRVCYAAQFTVAETQRALELCQLNRLYARDPRDALIMTCFNTRPGSVIDLNEILRKNKMEVLRPSGAQ